MNQKPDYLSIPTIPNSFIGQMVAHLNVEALGESSQIVMSRLNSKPKVTVSEYTDFFVSVCEELKDEMLGFLPKPVPLGSFATLCRMLQYSPDLSTAIEHYNCFYSLFLNRGHQLLDLSELRTRQTIRLNHAYVIKPQPMFQQTVILTLIKLAGWLAGQRLPIKQLRFEFEVHAFFGELNYVFGVMPKFGGGMTELRFADAALDSPVKPQNSARDMGENHIEHLLIWSIKSDIARRVYAEIAHRLEHETFDVVSIAGLLNMSKHTLSRRLKDKGTSYTEILTRVRKDKALYLLLNSTHPLERISEQLGFAEFGSFSRAFKDWTGVNPSQYRAQNR